jgi:hypothetical protein
VRSQLWELYADLKAYKAHPSPEKKIDLEARFDAIFTIQTSFETLNQTLRRIRRHKAELLLVLDRPDIALHTSGSERDLRDPVKKRKLSCIGILPMMSVEGPEVTWGNAVGIPS